MPRPLDPRDWLATAAAMGGVLFAMTWYEFEQRVAIRFSSAAQQRSVCRMARTINRATRLAGTHFRVEGLEHVVRGTPYILVSNHQSMFDISMTSDFLESLAPRYVSKRELARGVPGVSYNLAHGGSALIDRNDAAQSLAEIERLARHVRDDRWSVLIFPEGTRSKTGAMRPFREGGLRTLVANAPGVEVLPITTSGGSKLFAHGLLPVVRNVELSYRVHAPMAPADPGDAAAFHSFVLTLHERIRAGLPDDERDLGPEPSRS